MKRLVVDASTLTSGVASRHGGGAPWLLLLALLDFEFEAVVCPKLLQGFSDALGGRYFQERFDSRDLEGIVTSVGEAATEYSDPAKIVPLLRDPDDDYLVTLAREPGAEAIVSGDKDLLDHPDLEPQALNARSACQLWACSTRSRGGSKTWLRNGPRLQRTQPNSLDVIGSIGPDRTRWTPSG